eukprot:COSAG01_NODE_1673_length_9542_cov_12.825765_1_plen_79_part_00
MSRSVYTVISVPPAHFRTASLHQQQPRCKTTVDTPPWHVNVRHINNVCVNVQHVNVHVNVWHVNAHLNVRYVNVHVNV